MQLYKFRATFKNIETNENERTEECIASYWSDALEHFAKQIYKKIGDAIVKIELVAKVAPMMTETPI